MGEILLREQLVSSAQLRTAQERSRSNKTRLGAELVKLGALKEDDMTSILSRMHRVPSVNIADIQIPDSVIQTLQKETAQRHMCMPINRSGATLVVAMADPSDLFAVDSLKFSTGFNIEVVVASETSIQDAINQYYGAPEEAGNGLPNLDSIMADLEEDIGYVDINEEEENDLGDGAEDAPVIKLVNAILVDAIKRGTSDIHIEPYEKEYRVRFRVDGVLMEIMRPPLKLKNAISSRIKTVSYTHLTLPTTPYV